MAKKKKAEPKLIDQIRQAVLNADETRYRIAQNSGISEASLSKFVAGKGLSLEAIDTLGEYLGLEIARRKKGGH